MINIKKLHPIDIELIRLGKDNDGGYVIPKIILNKSDGLLSFGINTVSYTHLTLPTKRIV